VFFKSVLIGIKRGCLVNPKTEDHTSILAASK